MRPTKLIMSAFGPYASKTTVDYDALGESGIYLITGDTGAGKTTIFDAISFALFGSPSGDVRDSKMLRSKYADERTPTYVELFFEYAGKTYRIKRNPQYERARERGEGLTEEKANAELELPDGRVISNRKEVNDKVIEILGIDHNQFSQIAMIAQGDFRKLLFVPTNDRKTIFRKLFNTGNFEKFQDQISNDCKVTRAEYGRYKESIQQFVNDVVCDENDSLSMQLAEAKEGNMLIADTEELIQKITLNDEKAYNELDSEYKEAEKKHKEVSDKISRGEVKQTAYSQMASAEKKKAEKEKELPALKDELTEAKKHEGDIEKLKGGIAVSESELSNYDAFEETGKRIIRLNLEKADTERKLKSVDTEIENCNAGIEELRLQQDSINEAKVKRENVKNADSSFRTLTDGNGLESRAEDIETIKAEKTEYVKAFKELRDKAVQAGSEYLQKNQSFLEAQAGILAEQLSDNMPCPVCGSLNHPAPAVKSSEVPDSGELKKAQEKVNSLNSQLQDTSTKLAEINKEFGLNAENLCRDMIETEKKVIENITAFINLGIAPDRGLTCIPECFSAVNVNPFMEEFSDPVGLSEIKDDIRLFCDRYGVDCNQKEHQDDKPLSRDINSAMAALGKYYSSVIKPFVKQYDDLDNKADSIKNQMEALESSIKTNSEKQVNLSEEIGEKSSAIKESEKAKAEIARSLKFESKEKAREQIENDRQHLKSLENAVKAAEDKYRSCKEEIDKQKTAIENLRAVLNDKEEYDMEALYVRRTELEKEKSQINIRKQEAFSQKQSNRNFLDKIRKKSREMDITEKRLIWLESLSNTANGKLSGKDKIMFETYIQMKYFDRIIHRANLRLKGMTDGQYELLRARPGGGNAQSGLDLNVIDHFNNSERSAKSLSGGESFKAALSLALGLADEIQSSVGGVQMNTMFIDEGFGSLDPESLKLAINTLISLCGQDRLVGIISHVEDLKRKVDKQIVVEKDKTGASSVKIVV